MPKMKTHRSGKKRYKITGSGKIMRRQAGENHFRCRKNSQTKRELSGEVELFAGNKEKVKMQLPYMSKHR